MAAGRFKRFEVFIEGKRIPKPLAPVDGRPLLARTIGLVREVCPGVPIYISMPKDLIGEYIDAIHKHVKEFDAFACDKQEEGFKFTNVYTHVVDNCAILYGDCVYDKEDLSRLLTCDPPAGGMTFLRRGGGKNSASIIGTKYKEMYGIKTSTAAAFQHFADAAFKAHGAKCTSHHLYDITKPKDTIPASPMTDDIDFPKEYEAFVKIYGGIAADKK